MPTLLILCGIPGSTYSSYAKKLKGEYEILSRDDIRNNLFGKDCLTTHFVEKSVTETFNFKLEKAYLCRLNIVLSNTNCSEEYIDRIIAECPVVYDIKIKFFYISLWRAYFRNHMSFLRGERYVPFFVIKKLKKKFDTINKTKYQYAEIL